MSAYMQLCRVLPKDTEEENITLYNILSLYRCGKAYGRLSKKVVMFIQGLEDKLNKPILFKEKDILFCDYFYSFKIQPIMYRQGWYFKGSFLDSEAMTRIFTDVKEAYYGLPKIMDLNKRHWYYNNALEAYRSILNTWEELDREHPGEYFLEVSF